MNTKRPILIILAIIIILAVGAGAAWWFNQSKAPATPKTEDENIIVKQPPQQDFILMQSATDKTIEADGYRTWENGLYVHKIAATLPQPAGISYYQGWLINPQTKDTLITGKLTPKLNRWAMTYSSEIDRKDYTQVLITRETVADPTAPGTILLQGDFVN